MKVHNKIIFGYRLTEQEAKKIDKMVLPKDCLFEILHDKEKNEYYFGYVSDITALGAIGGWFDAVETICVNNGLAELKVENFGNTSFRKPRWFVIPFIEIS